MKRRGWTLAIALLLLLTLLGGCGAASSAGGAASSGGGTAYSGTETEMADAAPQEASVDGKSMYSTAQSAGTENSGPKRGDTKLIHTADLTLETTDFQNAEKGLRDLVSGCGGYFEQSSVSNYGDGYRRGSYTVRVPADQFDAFLVQTGELCHVLSQSSQAEDVSENYYDTQGRLKTQQTKLERLQVLLAKADKMEDIITLESAISDTEQTIENLSGTLQHYDSLVDYATVTISLSEVYKLSNVEEPASGFLSRVGTAFASGWRNFVGAVESFAVTLAYGWVWVLVLAAVAVVTVRSLRGRRRKHMALPGGGDPEKKTEK